MFWKKDVLINSCSESCQGKFSVKILEKYLWRSSFLVKLHNLVPGSFYLRKKPVKKTIFRFLYYVTTSGNATESCRLSACNFTKNELLHRYFSRILTANFRTPIFQNISQVAASAEAYWDLVKHWRWSFFVNIINGLKLLSIFTKKLHLRCF